MTLTEPIIRVDKVSKRFRLRLQRPFILHEALRRLLLRSTQKDEDFWALKDLSFSVPKGGSLGIVGGNGAGKSTLLSLLIGASHPTSGTIMVSGKVGALLELGAGFHPDLTGRENILLNASLSGLSQSDISRKMSDIIDFSELGDFIDVPIRNYSSGMNVRLGFSVAIHVDPEILIIDEALSVGDADFQKKSLDRIQQIKSNGATFIVVSHSVGTVESLCDQALWLDHGKLIMHGEASEVCAAYASGSFPQA